MNNDFKVLVPFDNFWNLVKESAELNAMKTHLEILLNSDSTSMIYKEEVAKICGIELKEEGK